MKDLYEELKALDAESKKRLNAALNYLIVGFVFFIAATVLFLQMLLTR